MKRPSTATLTVAALAAAVGVAALMRPKPRRARQSGKRPGWARSGSVAGYEYVTRSTGGLADAAPGPPILMFHGYAGNPEAYAAHLLDNLDRPAHVIIPRGKNPGPKWWTARAADADQDQLAAQMAWTADDFAPFLEAVAAAFGQRPLVVGHSQGAMMATTLALTHPNLVRGAVGSAGWVPTKLQSYGHPPVTLVHGMSDTTVPYGRTKAWAETDPDIEFITVSGGHGLSGELLDTWIGAVDEALAGPLSIGKSFEAVFRARAYPHRIRNGMVRRHNAGGKLRHSGIGARR